MHSEIFKRYQGKQFVLAFTPLHNPMGKFIPFIHISGIIEGETDSDKVIPCKMHIFKIHHHPHHDAMTETREGDVTSFSNEKATDDLVKAIIGKLETLVEDDDMACYQYSKPNGIAVNILIADAIPSDWMW